MKINDIVEFLNLSNISYIIDGNSEQEVMGYSSIFQYHEDTITWLREISTLEREDIHTFTNFACVITQIGTIRIKQASCQIWVENPKDVFFDILDRFWGEETAPSISSLAIIEEGAVIGERASIGPFTHISSQTRIGDDCKIGSNVVIKGKVTIGNHCVIQSGAVLGEDGFGFIKKENVQKFVKHYGGVILEDHVQIGSQTCVCRGVIDDTCIKEYTKIDNLCHIAHNVEIGKRCLVISGAVIMGSVHIGNDCWISASVIRNLQNVGDDSVVGMGAVVGKDVPAGATVAGNPARIWKDSKH